MIKTKKDNCYERTFELTYSELVIFCFRNHSICYLIFHIYNIPFPFLYENLVSILTTTNIVTLFYSRSVTFGMTLV